MWSEAQLLQLRKQTEAYKQLITKGSVDSQLLQEVQLGSAQNQIAQMQRAHALSMKARAEKFESNHQLYFFDLWEYVKRKLDSPDFVTHFAHPLANKPHPSASATDLA